ncbi:MAG: SusD/RagB family nutrient-binding outer membrane lipoprotein [Bacteroidetes bacterium]|nr:SusD/RagB family nutrient-binding outer membrane lipoprotein [Bacteroidota bacterium]
MRIPNKIIAYTTGLVLLLSGCKKQLDINHDPNNPPVDQATPKLVFPGAVMSSAATIGGEYAILGMLWSEFTTEDAFSSQYRNLDSYSATSSDLNTNYGELYTGALSDYQLVLEKAVENGDWNYYLMATVMKAYSYATLVDLYDKIPFTEALQGDKNLQPKFDDGQLIYDSLINEIDVALAQDFTARTNTDPGASDFIFGGNIDKWKAFANTLKLKLYLRMVNVNDAAAQAGITKLYNDGAVFLTEDAGISTFTSVPGKQNPFYSYNIFSLNTTNNLRASITFLSWLKANGDPRIVSYFGSPTAVGIHQGDFQNTTDPTYANAATFVQAPTDPVQFISGPESYFMQAEARERYFSGDQAKALYDAGVTAAFNFWGFDASSFIGSGDVYEYPTGGTFDAKLDAIITQKWASLPGSHALEGWLERNRTGFPKSSPVYSTDPAYVPGEFVVAKATIIGQNYPKRLVIPDEERSTNKNTPDQVPITAPVWWGK